jgi:5-methylcytosine-specific restriction endonuclease McrA
MADATKLCFRCEQKKNLTEFGKCKASPDGLKPRCNPCRSIDRRESYYADLGKSRSRGAAANRAWRKDNPDRVRATSRQYRTKHPYQKKPRVALSAEEKLLRKRASRIKTYEKNKTSVLAQAAIYRVAHKEEEHINRVAHYQRNKEHVAKTTKAYRLAHPDMYNAAYAKVRAGESMPSWVDQAEILKFYTEASRLTRETGIQHEVDHIYPVKNKISCGLHVPWNLQILTRSENRKKANRLPQD